MTIVSHNRQVALELASRYYENRSSNVDDIINAASRFEEFLRSGGNYHHPPQRDKGG